MATKKATRSTKSAQQEQTTGTELAPWEQRMAEKAAEAAESAGSTGGSTKSITTRGGRFSIDGAEVEDNVLQVVILDFLVDVTYYEDDYDPDEIVPPTASALGRNEKTMVWADNSHPDYAGELLKDSEIFQWGSAPKGRGKAAKSKRRLIVVPEDYLDDPSAAENEPRKLMVPVTSGSEFDKYVKQVKSAHNRPPCGVLTEVSIVPDPKSQFKLKFKMLGLVDDEAMPDVLDASDAIQEELFRPYQDFDHVEAEAEPAKASKGVARSAKARKPAKGRR